MTIIQNEQLKHGPQEKWFKNFHDNFDLNVTAQEMEQQPHLQWELLENHYSQYSEMSGKMEKHRDNISLEDQQQGSQVPRTKAFKRCVGDLLILAQSAEIVAQSEYNVAGVHSNNQENTDLHSDLVDQMPQKCPSNINVDDQECSQELLDKLSAVSHVSSQWCVFCYVVTRTRLTKIRKQARCKHLVLDQERAEESPFKHSQGKTTRLNQIKHQARCKSKNDLSPQMISRLKDEQPKGRILRLSQMKHQARFKFNSTVKDGTEAQIDESLPHNSIKDNEKVIARQFVKKNICQGDSNPSVEGVPAHNFYRGASQSSIVRWDIENLKEHQRTARRLRALKTKKLRQQSRKECERNYSSARLHAMRASLTGLTANLEAQKEFMPVKRLRLTQLRHEARLGNRYSAMQGLPGKYR